MQTAWVVAQGVLGMLGILSLILGLVGFYVTIREMEPRFMSPFDMANADDRNDLIFSAVLVLGGLILIYVGVI